MQNDLLKMCENFPALDKLFDYMCLLLGRRLQDVGLISKNADTNYLVRVSIIYIFLFSSKYVGGLLSKDEIIKSIGPKISTYRFGNALRHKKRTRHSIKKDQGCV